MKVEIHFAFDHWPDGIDNETCRWRKASHLDRSTPSAQCATFKTVLRNISHGLGTRDRRDYLWKVVMNHSQNIEYRLTKEFPESARYTDVEARLVQRARQELDSSFQVIREEAVAALYDNETEKPTVTQ